MGRRRYRSEEKPNEELEDDIIDQDLEDEITDEELDDEDIDQDLEDETIDEELDDEDIDQDLEDEDIDQGLEDEDQTPQQARRAKKATRLKERRRCAGLNNLAKIARRLGVRFNASKEIANGTSLAAANANVLRAAALKDSKLKVSAHRPSSSSFSSKKQAQLMWKKSKTRGKR